MKENVSGCFFPEHSVVQLSKIVLLAMSLLCKQFKTRLSMAYSCKYWHLCISWWGLR